MSAPAELPKGFLRTMLEGLLPRGLKGEMIRGDLLEEFRALAKRSSERQARAWYRRQTRRILWAVASGRISRVDLKSGVPAARGSALGNIIEDATYALRRFRKEPGYAAVAIVTIAIGIGANTAIFSVLDAVILRPLPFPEPERLVQIWETNPEYVAAGNQAHGDVPINALNYNVYAEQNRTLSGMAYISEWEWDDGYMAVGGGAPGPRSGSVQRPYRRPSSRSWGLRR